MKIDDEQFDRLISIFQTRNSFVDTMTKVMPLLTVLVIGVWTLYEYHAFVQTNQRLTNEQLSSELIKTDSERKTIENKAVIQEFEIQLARKRHLMFSVDLNSVLIEKGETENLYRIDYSLLMKNESKKTMAIKCNIFVPLVGRTNLDRISDFKQVKAPESFDPKINDNDVVQWHRQLFLCNVIEDAEAKYIEKISKYAPYELGRAGTGEIEPGEDLEACFTYYVRACPHDWFAVIAHTIVGEGDHGKLTNIEWIALDDNKHSRKSAP